MSLGSFSTTSYCYKIAIAFWAQGRSFIYMHNSCLLLNVKGLRIVMLCFASLLTSSINFSNQTDIGMQVQMQDQDY